MKFHKLALAAAAVVPFVTGCAEEGAEGFEAAYPVGVAATSRADIAVAADADQVPQRQPPPIAAPPGSAWSGGDEASESGEIAIGADAEPQADQYDDADPAALTDFRPALDPYGAWVEDATYGTAWVPSASVVGSDFAPYQTAGHWVYDDDYVWVSDYDWGWAPFHYGRWVYAAPYGWEWIPGRRYAGAWVTWRYGWGDWGYVGWAPLAPTWCWHGRAAVGIGFVPRAPYAFVATHDLFERGLGGRVVAGAQVGAIAAHTRPWISASPGVVGRVAASPAIGGPPPSTLRIPASALAGGAIDRGVVQARAFARPSTALAMGATLPGTWAGRPTASVNAGIRTALAAPNSAASYSVRAPYAAPASGAAAPSHFGGRLGGGFIGAPAAGPMRAPAVASRPYFGPSPSVAPSVPSVAAPGRPMGGGFPSASPSFRSAPSFATPSFRGTPAPSFHSAPSVAPGGSFHGGGGYSSGFSPGGGGGGGVFHGGGGGGFHGGGGGGRGGGGGHR